jgi:hypothetical protein
MHSLVASAVTHHYTWRTRAFGAVKGHIYVRCIVQSFKGADIVTQFLGAGAKALRRGKSSKQPAYIASYCCMVTLCRQHVEAASDLRADQRQAIIAQLCPLLVADPFGCGQIWNGCERILEGILAAVQPICAKCLLLRELIL